MSFDLTSWPWHLPDEDQPSRSIKLPRWVTHIVTAAVSAIATFYLVLGPIRERVASNKTELIELRRHSVERLDQEVKNLGADLDRVRDLQARVGLLEEQNRLDAEVRAFGDQLSMEMDRLRSLLMPPNETASPWRDPVRPRAKPALSSQEAVNELIFLLEQFSVPTQGIEQPGATVDESPSSTTPPTAK